MIASFIGLPLATTPTPNVWPIPQSANVHGVPGPVVFSPSPFADGVNAPPPRHQMDY